jgi:hypothetical protein
MSNEYTLTIKVRKRDDLEKPKNIEDAVSIVYQLLLEGSFLEVVSVKGS